MIKIAPITIVIFVLLMAVPAPVVADVNADVNRALALLTPLMHDKGVKVEQRPAAKKIVDDLLKKHPGNAAVHNLKALVYMAVREGDIAITHANLACEASERFCADGQRWLAEIQNAFSWCVDFQNRLRECELVLNSGETLTLLLKDTYFTNHADEQSFIGKFQKMHGKMVGLKLTWVAKDTPYKVGEKRIFPLPHLQKLRVVSPQAQKDGWH